MAAAEKLEICGIQGRRDGGVPSIAKLIVLIEYGKSSTVRECREVANHGVAFVRISRTHIDDGFRNGFLSALVPECAAIRGMKCARASDCAAMDEVDPMYPNRP